MRPPFARLTLTIVVLGSCCLLAGCGTRPQGSSAADASGLIVFSGLGSGAYLHALRPDGSGLHPVALPETCSPKAFTRDGRMIACDQWTRPWSQYVREGRYGKWRGGRWRSIRPPRRAEFASWDVEFARQWAPTRDRIADASDDGHIVVTRLDGHKERVVARNGEVPTWSPDGTRLAFARCPSSFASMLEDYPRESHQCSLWAAAADGETAPRLLVRRAGSPPVWSPEGRFIAFVRKVGRCTHVCKHRIFIVPADGGAPRPVGPRLTEPLNLFWVPADAPALQVRRRDHQASDPLQLQRCVDIWNRARMRWSGVANVSVGKDGCRITFNPVSQGNVGYAGFSCTQPVPWSFQCPGHGGRLQEMDPDLRVWNAVAVKDTTLRLVAPPRGRRLPLPKQPPYPLLEGWVLPFRADGRPRPGLTFSKSVTGACSSDGFVQSSPDSVRCTWEGPRFSWLHSYCFKPPGRLRDGVVVLRAETPGSTRFVEVRVSRVKP